MRSIANSVPGDWVVIGYGIYCALLLPYLVVVFGAGLILKVKTWFWPRKQILATKPSCAKNIRPHKSNKKCKPIPKYGCKYERQWHKQLLKTFDENEQAYLETIYLKRQIFGAPWEFYDGVVSTIALCLFLAGTVFVFGILAWNGVHHQLEGIPGSFQDIPEWLENLIWFSIGTSGVLLSGGPLIMIVHQSLMRRLMGRKPVPSIRIDEKGVTNGALHIPWSAINTAFAVTRSDSRGNTSYDVAVLRKNEQKVEIFIPPPSDLMNYLPRHVLLTLGGTVAAQFCLVALLKYCVRFYRVHYGRDN